MPPTLRSSRMPPPLRGHPGSQQSSLNLTLAGVHVVAVIYATQVSSSWLCTELWNPSLPWWGLSGAAQVTRDFLLTFHVNSVAISLGTRTMLNVTFCPFPISLFIVDIQCALDDLMITYIFFLEFNLVERGYSKIIILLVRRLYLLLSTY